MELTKKHEHQKADDEDILCLSIVHIRAWETEVFQRFPQQPGSSKLGSMSRFRV